MEEDSNMNEQQNQQQQINQMRIPEQNALLNQSLFRPDNNNIDFTMNSNSMSLRSLKSVGFLGLPEPWKAALNNQENVNKTIGTVYSNSFSNLPDAWNQNNNGMNNYNTVNSRGSYLTFLNSQASIGSLLPEWIERSLSIRGNESKDYSALPVEWARGINQNDQNMTNGNSSEPLSQNAMQQAYLQQIQQQQMQQLNFQRGLKRCKEENISENSPSTFQFSPTHQGTASFNSNPFNPSRKYSQPVSPEYVLDENGKLKQQKQEENFGQDFNANLMANYQLANQLQTLSNLSSLNGLNQNNIQASHNENLNSGIQPGVNGLQQTNNEAINGSPMNFNLKGQNKQTQNLNVQNHSSVSSHLELMTGTSPSDQKAFSVHSGNSVSGKDSKDNVRWNSWSHEEEIFLVVAVLDRFFRRGSLATATKPVGDRSDRNHSAEKELDCWDDIKQFYDKVCKAWESLTENKSKPPLIPRSSSALCRHFKIMKVRAAEGDVNGTRDGNFRKFLREWDEVVNKNGRLVPDDLGI